MSILSLLNDLVLRDTTNPPLTNKGSALDFSEADGNLVKIFNAIQDIVSGVNVPAYDAGATYGSGGTPKERFVSYDNKIWLAVNATPFSGQTPAESAYWTQVTLAQLLGNPVALTTIAEVFDDTRLPEAVYSTGWQSSTAKTLFSAPLDIDGLSAVADKIIVPKFLIFALDAGAAAYDFGAAGIKIIYSTLTAQTIASVTQSDINSATDKYIIVTCAINSSIDCVVNDKLQMYAAADATTGTGTYYVKVFYSLIDKPF